MMTLLWMIGVDLRSLVSGLIGIALGDDNAQTVVSFLSLACRVVIGAALLDKFEGQFLSNAIIFLYDCKRGDFLLVIAL
jgi:hypothetical protein